MAVAVPNELFAVLSQHDGDVGTSWRDFSSVPASPTSAELLWETWIASEDAHALLLDNGGKIPAHLVAEQSRRSTPNEAEVAEEKAERPSPCHFDSHVVDDDDDEDDEVSSDEEEALPRFACPSIVYVKDKEFGSTQMQMVAQSLMGSTEVLKSLFTGQTHAVGQVFDELVAYVYELSHHDLLTLMLHSDEIAFSDGLSAYCHDGDDTFTKVRFVFWLMIAAAATAHELPSPAAKTRMYVCWCLLQHIMRTYDTTAAIDIPPVLKRVLVSGTTASKFHAFCSLHGLLDVDLPRIRREHRLRRPSIRHDDEPPQKKAKCD